VRRDLERRLRAIELKRSAGFEYWICQRDGMVRGPHGEQMTREAAESRCRSAGKLAFCETDMRL